MKLAHPRISLLGFRQEQLEWFANAALINVPEDYHVAVVCHTPLFPDWKGPILTTGNSYPNHYQIKNIIDAFIAGSIMTSYSDINLQKSYQSEVHVDYSGQGKRKFAGWFCGHAHKQFTTNIGTFKTVTLASSIPDKREELNNSLTNENVIGTDNQDAFNLISIDVQKSKVKMFGFGAARFKPIEYNY